VRHAIASQFFSQALCLVVNLAAEKVLSVGAGSAVHTGDLAGGLAVVGILAAFAMSRATDVFV